MDTNELMNYLLHATDELKVDTSLIKSNITSMEYTDTIDTIERNLAGVNRAIANLFALCTMILKNQLEDKYIVLHILPDDYLIDMSKVFGPIKGKVYIGKFRFLMQDDNYEPVLTLNCRKMSIVGEESSYSFYSEILPYIQFKTFDDPDTAKLYAECAD